MSCGGISRLIPGGVLNLARIPRCFPFIPSQREDTAFPAAGRTRRLCCCLKPYLLFYELWKQTLESLQYSTSEEFCQIIHRSGSIQTQTASFHFLVLTISCWRVATKCWLHIKDEEQSGILHLALVLGVTLHPGSDLRYTDPFRISWDHCIIGIRWNLDSQPTEGRQTRTLNCARFEVEWNSGNCASLNPNTAANKQQTQLFPAFTIKAVDIRQARTFA